MQQRLSRRYRCLLRQGCRRRGRAHRSRTLRRCYRRRRSAVLRLIHASAYAACAALSGRDRRRRHRHVGLLVGCRHADRPGQRCFHRAAGDPAGRRVGASACRRRCRGGDESRPASAKTAPRAGPQRPPRQRDLCRARHHGGCEDDPARRQTRRRCALFCRGAGAGLEDATGSRAVTGHLSVIGLGPGDPRYLTPEAQEALITAQALYGYGPYLDRVPARAGQSRYASDNREERVRANAALGHAASGARVAIVSGGDPGVFAMAAAVCERIETGPESWRAVYVAIIPGVTAMLAVAARIGAPLGHDFCAISLSDNLKPWPLIEQRLDAAAGAGFVIALYSPVSRARPWQLGNAIERLRRHLPPTTPVIFGRAVGRVDEHINVVTLDAADSVNADMATLVIVGSRDTRVIARPGRHALVYTPRAAAEVSA